MLKEGVGEGSCALLKLASCQNPLDGASLQLVAVGYGVDGSTCHESIGAGWGVDNCCVGCHQPPTAEV